MMKFLIDGHISRVLARRLQAPQLVAGHLLTPVTGYRLCPDSQFAVDNGGFSFPRPTAVASILRRYESRRHECLFVAIPDVIASHKETLEMWDQYNSIADGWPKAFVLQDGFDGTIPDDVAAIFIGGTNDFKDSNFALELIDIFKDVYHCHVGRVNTPKRYLKFNERGAHTCDGSGISRYDYMILDIQEALNAQ